MPFISLPPQIVYTRDNLELFPQHQELIFDDPNDGGARQRFTIYTGEILIDLSADDHHKDLTFQYPILGTFKDPAGAPAIGIKPIGNSGSVGFEPQFRSATAFAFLTSSEFGSNPVWANVGRLSADLIEIELDASSRQVIHVAVLSGLPVHELTVDLNVVYKTGTRGVKSSPTRCAG